MAIFCLMCVFLPSADDAIMRSVSRGESHGLRAATKRVACQPHLLSIGNQESADTGLGSSIDHTSQENIHLQTRVSWESSGPSAGPGTSATSGISVAVSSSGVAFATTSFIERDPRHRTHREVEPETQYDRRMRKECTEFDIQRQSRHRGSRRDYETREEPREQHQHARRAGGRGGHTSAIVAAAAATSRAFATSRPIKKYSGCRYVTTVYGPECELITEAPDSETTTNGNRAESAASKRRSFAESSARRNSNATWWRWSQDRRASILRRQQNQEPIQGEPRLSAAVLRARQESRKFIAPELEEHKRSMSIVRASAAAIGQEVMAAEEGGGTIPRKPPRKETTRELSLAEWEEVVKYWDHESFNYARLAGLGVFFLSLIFMFIAIGSARWSFYRIDTTSHWWHSGLWTSCNIANETCSAGLSVAPSVSVPDNKAYEKRYYSDEFYAMEIRRAKYRRLGALSSATAIAFIGIGLQTHSRWIHRHDQIGWSGLWDNCYVPPQNATTTTAIPTQRPIRLGIHEHEHFHHPDPYFGNTCHFRVESWQKAVIGLLIFAVSFGFFGAILSILGVCVTYLPRKIYYFHSAGEIFFVAALGSAGALVIYPVSIERYLRNAEHKYGYAYGLAWASTVLFCVSAFCMMLDDIMAEASRPRTCCCCCCRGHSSTHTNIEAV